MAAGLVVTFAALGVMLFWLLYPYDAVRVSPEVGLVSPPVVEQGGTVQITRESFCNDGVSVLVQRWADALGDDGRVLAAFDLGTVEFLNDGTPRCFEPSSSGVTLPNYVIGADGGAGTFRLRFDVSYRANPVRVVTVSSVSESFLVLPTEEPASAP
jgi:hypothetical protein